MWSYEDLQRWLDERYPDLRVRTLKQGDWCIEQMVDMVDYVELDPSYFIDGLAFKTQAATLVFGVKQRIVGSWVCDEIVRRDPQLWMNEGNLFHAAYKASFEAEKEQETRTKDAQASAASMWETAKRNPFLMERVSHHMEDGNVEAACREFAPETMYKHALKENPKELRRKDFWKAL